jgi:pantoate--beta-alanine ligase
MEGASRPTHFRGVTTIVAKLFNIVRPDVAVFGAKDYQQAAVIRRMVRDLNFPVRLIVAPTRRERDGLAMSSRNKYLSGDQRRQATVLSKALRRAQQAIRNTRTGVPLAKLRSELKQFIETERDVKLEYVDVFHPETLEPLPVAQRGTHLALAAFVGRVRLIDNARL